MHVPHHKIASCIELSVCVFGIVLPGMQTDSTSEGGEVSSKAELAKNYPKCQIRGVGLHLQGTVLVVVSYTLTDDICKR